MSPLRSVKGAGALCVRQKIDMVTVLQIIDTAVKIGLGALISGVVAWLLARQAANQRIKQSEIEDIRALVKELAIQVEAIKAIWDDIAHSFFTGDLDEAKAQCVEASKACHSAKALANIVGNPKIMEAIETANSKSNETFHELRLDQPSLKTLEGYEKVAFDSIDSLQPELSKAYREVNA